MKLFYKKDYLETKQELEFLIGSYDELSRDFAKAIRNSYDKNKKIETYEEKIKFLKKQLELKTNDISKLEQKLRSINASKGGLTKEKNKLKIENKQQASIIETLRNELAEALSDKYVRIELPPEKPKRTKVMGMRRGTTSKSAKAILKSKNESKEKN